MRENVFSDLAVTILAQFIYEIVKPFSSDVKSLKLLVRGFHRLLLIGTRKRLLLFTTFNNIAATPRSFGLEEIHTTEVSYLLIIFLQSLIKKGAKYSWGKTGASQSYLKYETSSLLSKVIFALSLNNRSSKILQKRSKCAITDLLLH